MDDAEFLELLNAKPFALNNSLKQSSADVPHIWVIGLPRSGTTLTMQLLCQYLDIGYINNLMARFWASPFVGACLSKIILGDRNQSSFVSVYGKTGEPHGPHEYSYFWHDLLGIADHTDIDFARIAHDCNWMNVKQTLNNIAHNLNKNMMVYKALWPAYFADVFAEIFPNSIFVVIERSVIDVACSLALAREAYYGDRNCWWSMTYPGYQKTLELPYEDQIAIQLRELTHIWAGKLAKIADNRKIQVNYEDLCRQPNDFLERVKSTTQNLGVEPPTILAPPSNSFTPLVNSIEKSGLNKIEKAIATHFPTGHGLMPLSQKLNTRAE